MGLEKGPLIPPSIKKLSTLEAYQRTGMPLKIADARTRIHSSFLQYTFPQRQR